MTKIKADVAILGGGLVGPALGLALAQNGLEVAIIEAAAPDQQADPGFDGRAYAIALGSARLLDALGLWHGLAPMAQTIEDIEVGEGTGSPVLLHFDPRQIDEGRVGWILEDRHLRGALLRALGGAASGSGLRGALHHLAPAEVTEIAERPGAMRLTLTDRREVHAPLLVGADGRRSAVAREAGIRRIAWTYAQTGLVAAILHERPHGGTAHQSFLPGGPFAVLPLPGGQSSIVWSERDAEAERLMALDEEAYARELAMRIGPRLGAVTLAGRRYAHPLGLTIAERYVAPRRALVGDAAHGVHPIAGQGLNLGLRDVAALAEVAVEAARRGEDLGGIDVLVSYERWRRFDAASFALGTDALNRLFSNGLPLLGPMRRAGLAVVDRSPAVKRFLMREAAGLSGTVPRLLAGWAL